MKRQRKRIGGGYRSGSYSTINEICVLCKGSDALVVLRRGRKGNKDGTDAWYGCDVCSNWYHVMCLGDLNIDVTTLDIDDVWLCPECNRV